MFTVPACGDMWMHSTVTHMDQDALGQGPKMNSGIVDYSVKQNNLLQTLQFWEVPVLGGCMTRYVPG